MKYQRKMKRYNAKREREMLYLGLFCETEAVIPIV